ncbi:unnamed protein product [Periconia digitata]|uniref:Major facilitator superfamily (MFS) profile domain-containing protein n=1 Tax=Periconia digitata TaxID=1303443 RepID=A0A9W4UL78_9PLEO|nr:unnamed protein product [Periconia digitata]
MATEPEISSHDEKGGNIQHKIVDASENSSGQMNTTRAEDSVVDTNFQKGVQDIEAVTIYWSKRALIASYLLIWFVYFVQALVAGVTAVVLPYVTSAFMEHSLTATTSVLSSVICGVTNLTIGKALDIFGRPQGFLCCVVVAVIGLIISAACKNVESYAASQVLYLVGINGVGFSMNVFLADISSLRYRGLVVALCSTGNIITPWLAGPVSKAFLDGPGWRWAFGMESILIPVATLPVFGLFMYHLSQAKKQGIVPSRSGRHSPSHYLREFDVVGLFLLSAGVAFFLLPFNLYTMQAKGWGSAIIICFLVFGILLLVAFAVWERFFASISLIPWNLLQDRTGLGACFLSLTLFLSNSCWGAYFGSILQVTNGLDVTHASYVVQTYSVANFFFTIFAGLVISWTGRYKPITLYLAIPFEILGAALMIHFRQPVPTVGYIVMCQIFIAFGSGIIMITAEIAMLAICEKQQYFAIGLAVLSLFSNIGNAIGFTISSAIWQNVLPMKLALYLPAEDQPNLATIYGDIVTQLSYPADSPTRLAIQHAYGDCQKYLFIAGTAVWLLGIVSTMIWRNINVIGIKQTKGHVF